MWSLNFPLSQVFSRSCSTLRPLSRKGGYSLPHRIIPMPNNDPAFNRGVVRPIECLTSGFEMIKGQYWLVLGITVVGMLVGALVPMGVLMGPMMCGIYLVL